MLKGSAAVYCGAVLETLGVDTVVLATGVSGIGVVVTGVVGTEVGLTLSVITTGVGCDFSIFGVVVTGAAEIGLLLSVMTTGGEVIFVGSVVGVFPLGRSVPSGRGATTPSSAKLA